MQTLDDKAQQAMETMKRVKRRVYSCTVVCLLLIGPMVCLVYLWDSRWGALSLGVCSLWLRWRQDISKCGAFSSDQLEGASPTGRVSVSRITLPCDARGIAGSP